MDAKIENWDDLRVFLATVRAGSVAAAARVLQIDPTTVSRRMMAFEESVGRKLFDRLRGGVILSPEGQVLAQGAQSAELAIRGAELEVAGQGDELSGTVRIAVAELLAMGWSARFLELARSYPALLIEIVSGDENHNLSKREADIAIRVSSEPPAHLVGRRFQPIAIAAYGASELRERYDIEDAPWIGWTGYDNNEGTVGAWRTRLGGRGPYALRVNSYGLIMEYLRLGAGITILPCGVGEVEPGLTRFCAPHMLTHPLWLLTHPDLQKTPRIRAVLDGLAAIITETEQFLVGVAREPEA